MKKLTINSLYALFFLISISLFSCDQNVENSNIEAEQTKITTEKFLDSQYVTEGICPEGFEPEYTLNISWDFFEKFDGLTCKDGWGMCNQLKIKFILNCKKIKSIQPAARATFDPITGSGVAAVVLNEDDKTLTLIFP